MTQEKNAEAPEWYFADHADDSIDISDYACALLPNLDYEAQLDATKRLAAAS